MYPLVLLTLMFTTTFILVPSLVDARSSFLSHAHKVVKRSPGLAHDLRIALGGVFLSQPGSAPIRNTSCILDRSGGGTPTTTSTPQPTTTPLGQSSPWKPIASYSGSTFFDGWTFFTGADPTNGTVAYVDRGTAQNAGLISINSVGNTVMRVETTPTVRGNRQSVRISTNLTFTEGLVVLDAVHMPTGCGTWPAFWTEGVNWPVNGEIDIAEGINNFTSNRASIHTGVGCSISSSNSTLLGITGTVIGSTDCAAVDSNDAGCGVQAASNTSFGTGFNSVGGGIYALYWDNSVGIKVWFFQRGSIPNDITTRAPHPENWPTPMAFWANSDLCNISNMFRNHNAIFDTTLCGIWAGPDWNSTGSPGQSVSCQQQTGYATCSEFVQANGASFNEAYWEVTSVTIYQDTSSSSS